MNSQYVSLEKSESIASVILNRPDSLNALNIPLAEELWDALEECDREDKIRVVIIRGAGRAFCAGGDIKAMLTRCAQDGLAFMGFNGCVVYGQFYGHFGSPYTFFTILGFPCSIYS